MDSADTGTPIEIVTRERHTGTGERIGRTRAVACLAGAALLMCGAPQAQTAISVSGGLDFSSGDYGGDSTTDVWSTPLRFELRRHPWSARLTLAEVWIRGDARLVDRRLAISDPSATGGDRRTEHGIGDVELSGARTFQMPIGFGAASPLYADARISVKLPTADEDKGLGSGRADLSLQADLYAVAGSFTPFLTAGHRWRGSRSDLQLEDGWFAYAGVDHKTARRLRLGAYLSWIEPASTLSDDALEFIPYASFDLDDRWQIIGYGRAGFTDGSPEAGAGIGVRYRFELAPERPRILLR